MADDLERTSNRMDAEMEVFERKRRANFIAPSAIIPYREHCLHCFDATIGGAAYCDSDCEADAIKIALAKKRNGM